MSSSMLFLAYAFKEPQGRPRMAVRMRGADGHLDGLFEGSLTRTQVGDEHSGFIVWRPSGEPSRWSRVERDEDGSGAAWIHVPSAAGGPESASDPLRLAFGVTEGRVDRDSLAPPFAVATWARGELHVMNDQLGMARIFHYSFPDGDVWATRMGLAHVFMGVAPAKNDEAWAGMATLGWAVAGKTQLGDGSQLPGRSHVVFRPGNATWPVSDGSTFPEWFARERSMDPPLPARQLSEMGLSMATAARWPEATVADLSGGKDSRLVAAVGIASGTVNAVRTVRTDHGEVEVATDLVSMLPRSIGHKIVDRKDPASPRGTFYERVLSQHRAFEGRYLAASAFNRSAFASFKAEHRANFNGLGGEILAGGNMAGNARQRLAVSPARDAIERLSAMVRSSPGSSEPAREQVLATISGYAEAAEESGIRTALGALDFFYLVDRMPYWSVVFTRDSTICPLFAPSVLRQGLQSMGHPPEVGAFHRALISEVYPQWGSVPFYSPTAKRRATPYVWESRDWSEIRGFIEGSAVSLESFDGQGLGSTLRRIEAGRGLKREEVVVMRIVWEALFDEFVAEIRAQSAGVARLLRDV